MCLPRSSEMVPWILLCVRHSRIVRTDDETTFEFKNGRDRGRPVARTDHVTSRA